MAHVQFFTKQGKQIAEYQVFLNYQNAPVEEHQVVAIAKQNLVDDEPEWRDKLDDLIYKVLN